MQYGEAGKGIYGELPYLGGWDEYLLSRGKVCYRVADRDPGQTVHFQKQSGKAFEAMFAVMAKRIWDRWQNRDVGGWCEYCGKSRPESMGCGSCKKAKVQYCCKEHQKAGWKLYTYTCESKEKS